MPTHTTVNHPFFHALVFLLGVIVVLVRHVKADELPALYPGASSMLAIAAAAAPHAQAGWQAIV